MFLKKKFCWTNKNHKHRSYLQKFLVVKSHRNKRQKILKMQSLNSYLNRKIASLTSIFWFCHLISINGVFSNKFTKYFSWFD